MSKYDSAQAVITSALRRAKKDGLEPADMLEALIVQSVIALTQVRGETAARAFLAFELANLDGQADLSMEPE